MRSSQNASATQADSQPHYSGKAPEITLSGRAPEPCANRQQQVAVGLLGGWQARRHLDVSGVLLRANDKLAADPNIAVADPYGEGWIAEMQASAWDAEKASLATGASGIAAYKAKLEADGIKC